MNHASISGIAKLVADDEFSNVGAVIVFDVDTVENTSTPLDTLWAPNQEMDSNFGASVDIDGDRIVVNDLGRGKAYAIKRTNGDWGTGASLRQPTFGGSSSDFGRAISINGKDIFITNRAEDVDGINDVGRVYYYRNSFANIWTFQNTLNTPNPSEFGTFGISVSNYNDYVVVGAVGEGDDGNGKIYIYKRDGVSWNLEQEFLGDPDDFLGERVIMKGNYIIATKTGVVGYNGKQDVGGANIYKFTEGVWAYSDAITYSLRNTDDLMGFSDVDTDMINFVTSSSSADVNGISNKGKVLFSSVDPN